MAFRFGAFLQADLQVSLIRAFLVVAPLACVLPLHAGMQHNTTALLDRYDQGDRAGVLRELASMPDTTGVTKDLEKLTKSWIAERGPDQLRHRQLVAATFALDAAALRFWPEETDPLVEWGCALVRGGARHDDAERLWFTASVAIFSRARDDGRIVTRAASAASVGQRVSPPVRSVDHIAHAEQEWPDERRFPFVRAIVAAAAADTEPPRDAPFVKTELLMRNSQERIRRDKADQAIRGFTPFLAEPSLRAEASVRIGYLQLTLGQTEAALGSLTAAEDADDPFVSYLARFLAGRTFDRIGRRNDAEAAYRAALALNADTQSANEALSADLFLGGRLDEAYALSARALSAASDSTDPWQEFGYGDRRFVPQLMTELYAVVTRR